MTSHVTRMLAITNATFAISVAISTTMFPNTAAAQGTSVRSRALMLLAQDAGVCTAGTNAACSSASTYNAMREGIAQWCANQTSHNRPMCAALRRESRLRERVESSTRRAVERVSTELEMREVRTSSDDTGAFDLLDLRRVMMSEMRRRVFVALGTTLKTACDRDFTLNIGNAPTPLTLKVREVMPATCGLAAADRITDRHALVESLRQDLLGAIPMLARSALASNTTEVGKVVSLLLLDGIVRTTSLSEGVARARSALGGSNSAQKWGRSLEVLEVFLEIVDEYRQWDAELDSSAISKILSIASSSCAEPTCIPGSASEIAAFTNLRDLVVAHPSIVHTAFEVVAMWQRAVDATMSRRARWLAIADSTADLVTLLAALHEEIDGGNEAQRSEALNVALLGANALRELAHGRFGALAELAVSFVGDMVTPNSQPNMAGLVGFAGALLSARSRSAVVEAIATLVTRDIDDLRPTQPALSLEFMVGFSAGGMLRLKGPNNHGGFAAPVLTLGLSFTTPYAHRRAERAFHYYGASLTVLDIGAALTVGGGSEGTDANPTDVESNNLGLRNVLAPGISGQLHLYGPAVLNLGLTYLPFLRTNLGDGTTSTSMGLRYGFSIAVSWQGLAVPL